MYIEAEIVEREEYCFKLKRVFEKKELRDCTGFEELNEVSGITPCRSFDEFYDKLLSGEEYDEVKFNTFYVNGNEVIAEVKGVYTTEQIESGVYAGV